MIDNHISNKPWSVSDLDNVLDCCKTLFSRESSILRSSMLFSLFFTSFEVDVTWLDEIAEGLKQVLTAINAAVLEIKGIHLEADPHHSLEENSLVVYL